MKFCRRCQTSKPYEAFSKNSTAKDKLHRYCKQCNAEYYTTNKERIKETTHHYRSERREEFNTLSEMTEVVERHVVARLLAGAKWRAEKTGIEFDLTIDDVSCPLYCPMLGIRLQIADGNIGDASPTLDRLDASRGYVKGNVHIISGKANRIKTNATTDEVRRVYEWMRDNL